MPCERSLEPIEDTVGALADLVEGKSTLIISQEDNIVAIPGKHLEENFDAIKVNLNSDELTEIRKFINSVKIIGDRYSSDILDMVGLNKYEVTITLAHALLNE
ncbi:12084_t:CDS:2 [Rhizophagus irregularis]|nr:12084_t:CDS:2 [Rhizophagus irregularis]